MHKHQNENIVAQEIRAMASQHGMEYAETSLDQFGHHITRLAGDDVKLDEVELLLLALRRKGLITSIEKTRLHFAYLSQANL